MGLRLDNTMQIRSDWGRFAWFERRGQMGHSDEPWINTLLVDEMHRLIEDGGMEHMISYFGTDHPDTQYVRNMEIAGRMMEGELGDGIKHKFPNINERVLVNALALVIGKFVDHMKKDCRMKESCAEYIRGESRTWFTLRDKVACELEEMGVKLLHQEDGRFLVVR